MSVKVGSTFWVKLDLGEQVTGKSSVLTYRVITPASGAVSTAFGGFTEPYAGFYMAPVTINTLGEHSLLVYAIDGSIARSSVGVTVTNQDIDSVASTTDMAFVRSIAAGAWQLTNNQMIFYAEDNVTEVGRYNLFDAAGVPTMTAVAKRLKV